MKQLFLGLIIPLAMGMMVSCNKQDKDSTVPEPVKAEPIVLVVCCNGDTVVAKPAPVKPKPVACDCAEVEKKFAEIKANRDSAFATATAQLQAQLTNKPACLKFNGTTSWSCGTFSGRDAGNSQSQLVLGGF
jgi:hypothetical protein